MTSKNKKPQLINLVSKEELCRLHREEGLKYSDIGKIYGFTGERVSQVMRGLGIPKLTPRERRELKGAQFHLEDLTKEQYAELYEKYTDEQMGIMAGYDSKDPARKMRIKLGVPEITKSERYKCKTPWKDEQKEVIIGSLLGDGTLINASKHKGVSFRCTHTYYQKDYLSRIAKVCGDHLKRFSYVEQENQNGRTYPGFIMQTRTSDWMEELSYLFYPKGERIFPEEVIKNLSWASLAYWYFDDGHYRHSDNILNIALGNISLEEADLLCEVLNPELDLEFTVPRYGSKKCRVMKLSRLCIQHFFTNIAKYATPDIYYKIPQRFRPGRVAAKRHTIGSKEFLLPRDIREGFKELVGKKKIYKKDRNALAGRSFDFWKQNGLPDSEVNAYHVNLLEDLPEYNVELQEELKDYSLGMDVVWNHSSEILSNFSDDDILKEVILEALLNKRMPTLDQLKKNLLRHSSCQTNMLKPFVSMLIGRELLPECGGRVLDLSHDHGSRLLGLICSGRLKAYHTAEESEALVGIRDYACGALGREVDVEFGAVPESVDVVWWTPLEGDEVVSRVEELKVEYGCPVVVDLSMFGGEVELAGDSYRVPTTKGVHCKLVVVK